MFLHFFELDAKTLEPATTGLPIKTLLAVTKAFPTEGNVLVCDRADLAVVDSDPDFATGFLPANPKKNLPAIVHLAPGGRAHLAIKDADIYITTSPNGFLLRGDARSYQTPTLERGADVDAVGDRILTWLERGERGLSSEAICRTLYANQYAAVEQTLGASSQRASPPMDPDDLRRCALFLEAVPEARARISEMGFISPAWEVMAGHWNELEALAVEEAGSPLAGPVQWHGNAPRTYALMSSLLASVANNAPAKKPAP